MTDLTQRRSPGDMLIPMSVRGVQALKDRIEDLEAIVAAVRSARGAHPECSEHPDEDAVTCGWKRAILDIDKVLDTAPEELLREANALCWAEGESAGRWNAEHIHMIEAGLRGEIKSPYENPEPEPTITGTCGAINPRKGWACDLAPHDSPIHKTRVNDETYDWTIE